MVRQPYPNELYHYGVLGMRWGHRKARIEERKERQRKYNSDYPIKSAVGKGLKTWIALGSAGILTAAAGATLLRSRNTTIGKIKAAGILAAIGQTAVAISPLAGVVSGVSQASKNLDNQKKNNS